MLAVVAGVAGGTWAAKHQVVSYQARSTMVVQSGASAIGPGGAAEASQLAITYATVIPTDTSILQQAAAQLGISEATLASRLTVSVQTGTAVFVISYKAPTSAEAVAGAAEVARVVGGRWLPSSTIPTGTVSVVDLASTASASGSMAKYGKELGGILGLIVGLILAMAAERADPRVDTADDLASVVGVPASLVPDELSPAELSRAIALEPAGANGVTVVPLARSNGALAGALAEQLRAAWPPPPGIPELAPLMGPGRRLAARSRPTRPPTPMHRARPCWWSAPARRCAGRLRSRGACRPSTAARCGPCW